MDTLKLEVTLTFSGKLSETERNETVKNFTNQIIRDIETAGIVPDDCNEYTERIIVKNAENTFTIDHKFMSF